MRSDSPVKEIKYTVNEAQLELQQVERDLIERVAEHLEARECGDVVLILMYLDTELELLVREARKLRLCGELNKDVFDVLVSGYTSIKDRIYELADQHKLLKAIRSLYAFRKYAARTTTQNG